MYHYSCKYGDEKHFILYVKSVFTVFLLLSASLF